MSETYQHISPAHAQDTPPLKSVVFRLKLKSRDAVASIAASTRISQSALLREAIQDLIAKYAESIVGDGT